MKQSAKRLLSMILCLCMLLSLLPATAMAAGGTESGGTASGGSSTTPSVADAFGFKTDPPEDFDAGDGVHPFSQSGTNDTINMVPVKEVGLLTTSQDLYTFNSNINVYNFSIQKDEEGNETSNLADFSADGVKLFSKQYSYNTSNKTGDDTFRLASGVAYDPTGAGRDDHVFYYGVDVSMIGNYVHTGEGGWNYLPMKDFSYEGGTEGTVASGKLEPNEENSQKIRAYDWALDEEVVDEAPDKYLSVTAGNFNGNGKETVVLYDPQYGNFTLRECTLDGENIQASPVFDLGNEITVKNKTGDYKTYTLNEMVTALRNVDSKNYFPKFMPLVQLAAGDLDGDEKDELVVTVTPIEHEYAGYSFDCYSWVLIFNKENDGKGNAVWKLKASTSGAYVTAIGDFNKDNKNELVLVADLSITMMQYSKGSLTTIGTTSIGLLSSQGVAIKDNDVFPIYSVPSVGVALMDGTGTDPYLYISGEIYKYLADRGEFIKFDDVDQSYLFENPIRRQPIIGNFDGNTGGREQIFTAVHGTKGNGDNVYGIECYSTHTGGAGPVLDYKHLESDADALGRMVLTAPDADTDDGMVIRYTGKEYVFSNPEVMAVLQASPYFEDLLDDYENVGVTGFGTSSGTGSSFSNTVSNTVGAYVSYSQDFEFLGIKVGSIEFQAAYNYEWSKTNETSHTYTTSISYEAGSGSNQVVMVATPVTVYHYDVLGLKGEPIATSNVSVPEAPCYTVISVEDYNASAELLGNPVIDNRSVVGVVPGQPQTYPSSKWQINSVGGVNVPFDTPVLAAQGNAVISQEVSWEDSQSLTKSYSHNIDVSAGKGPVGFVIGVSYGHSEERSSTQIVTSEVSRSGSVANVPAGNPDYSFKWQFATWDIRVGNYKVPVMGYIVSSVNQPPSVPQNLTATPGTDSVTLEWEPGYNSAVKYDIFRYYPEEKEDYQYDLIGTVDGTETSFVCEGLSPSTRYYFAVRAVGDKGLRSRYTEPVAVTTISPGQALPEIIIQPEDQYIDVSSTRETTFSTLANPTSHGVVNYAWERRDDSSSAWETISAGTYVAGYASRSLTLYDLTGSMDGTQYRCRVAERSAAPYPAVVYTRAATLTVGRAPTTTTLTSPSDAGYGVLGSKVTLSAKVAASDNSACGGNVSFRITNTTTGDVTTLMADTNNGVASANWTPFTAGVYTIRAAYAGDGTTESSVSETVTYYVQEDADTPCYEITLGGDLVYGEIITPSLQSVKNGQSTPVSDVTFMRYLHDGTEFKLDSSPEGWRYGILIPGEYRVDAVLNDEVVAQKVFTVDKRPITITAPTISSIVEGTKFDLSRYVGEIQYPDNLEIEYKHLFALSGVTAEKPLSGQYDISVVYANPDDPELASFLQRYQPTFEKSVFTVISSTVADTLSKVAFSAGVNGSVKAYVSTTSTKEITVSPYGVSKGSTVFFSPEADEGFSVSRWTINGTEVTQEAIDAGKFSGCGSVRLSGTGLIVEGLQSDINVNVEFTSLKYTVSFSGTGSGSVTAIQGSTELGSPVEVIGGSSITLTAVPAEGSVVKSWTIIPENGTQETKQNPDGSNYTGATLTLENINDNYTVDVEFEEAGTPLTVTCDVVDANGYLTDDGLVTFTAEGLSEDGTALKGSTVKLTANPKPGTAILRWEVYEGNTWVTKSAGTDEFTIYNLQADTNVRVVIRPNSANYTVGYSIIGKDSEDASAGTITAETGNRIISTGESCTAYASLTFTYEESEDYEFVGWNVTGTKGTEASNGTTHTYTISSLNQNTIVMAAVQKKPKVTVDSSIANGSVSVTYQRNGETVTPTTDGYVYTGTVATVTATPADGYVVDTIKANGTPILTGDKTGGAKTADVTINADTNLTATFEAVPTYTITFNSNGGTEVAPITLPCGTAVSAPTAPEKDGYTFGGWYTDSALTFAYEFSTMPAENITLYAKWTAQGDTKYTVKHNFENLDGSSYTTETEELFGATGADTEAQAKNATGFTAGSVTQQKIAADGSTVVEITYTRNMYTLTIKPENGEDDIVTTVKYGAAITTPADLEKTGYTFAGWDKDIPDTMPAEDVTITAKWTPQGDTKYTVKHNFENLDGSTYTTETEELSGTTGADTEAQAKNATGFTAGSITQQKIAADGSTVVEITYTRNSYILTFKPANGEENIVTTVKYGAAVTAPTAPEKTGYTFAGWDKDIPDTMPAENVTITAKWTPLDGIKYTVKHYYEKLNGNYEIGLEVKYGTTDADTEAQAKDVPGFTAESVAQQKIKGDGSTVIEIIYSRNYYTLTFKPENGGDDIVTTEKYGAAVAAPEISPKAGYGFGGWYTDSALTTAYVVSTMPAENITLYAKWNPLNDTKYTVKHNFENLDGSTYTTETEEMSGTTDTDTAAQAKNVTGFTAGSVTQQKIKGDESTVIEITYTRNMYTLTIKPENGEDDIVTTVKYGAAITTPADLEKTGYTFAGCTVIPDTMPAEDVTIKATWTANQYAITVESTKNGSVSADCNNAVVGNTVTLTVKPDKGYTLETLIVTDNSGNHISVENLGKGKYSFTMPASAVTVEATFMEDNSMLNFFVDVPVSAYYYDAVLWAAEAGITVGTSDTTFSPNIDCTRAQIVTFLWRMAGRPTPNSSTMPFTDVAKGSYYYNAVLWAVENGITAGTSATTFSPNAVCNRSQAIAFLWRAAGSPAVESTELPFTDVDSGAYYYDALLWAVNEGITAGTSDTTFSPNLNCTRAQIVTFLYRFLGK